MFPDYSNPTCTQWWTEQFSEFHKTLKFDGVWIVSCYSGIKLLLETDSPRFENEL